jgi:hypothetical protein
VAAEEVDRCAGTQFDPEIAETFLTAWESGVFGAAALPSNRLAV